VETRFLGEESVMQFTIAAHLVDWKLRRGLITFLRNHGIGRCQCARYWRASIKAQRCAK
jgi:hypothetical protein